MIKKEKVKRVINSVAREMLLLSLVLIGGIGAIELLTGRQIPAFFLFCAAIGMSFGAIGYSVRKALTMLFLEDDE